MSEALYIQSLEGALEHLGDVPLWGSPPAFDWKSFSSELAKLFELKKLAILSHKTEWKTKDQLLAGMGKDPEVKTLALSPLDGSFFMVFPKKTIEAIVDELLSSSFTDPTLQAGYFQFACLNVIETFNQINPFDSLSLSFADKTPLPEEGALASDIQIELGDKTLFARLLFPKNWQTDFSSHFEAVKEPITDPKFAAIPLTCTLEVGNTTLSAETWSKIHVGDLLLLDRCTYDVENKRGTATLTLGPSHLFEVRIKEGKTKILEYALTMKEAPMTEEDNLPSEEETLSEPSSEEEAGEKPLWSAENGEGESEEKLLSKKNIPISITVEVGRFQIPLEKLTKLEPGNVLDLKVSPELSVTLTTGGKKVAKGELVRLGDAIGVKILNLG